MPPAGRSDQERIDSYLICATPSGVAGFLGLDLPAGRQVVVRHERLADELNAQWIGRYRLREPERLKQP